MYSHGIAAQARPQVIANTADSRILSQQVKALGDCIDDSIRRRYASAFRDDVVPIASSSARASAATRCAITSAFRAARRQDAPGRAASRLPPARAWIPG